jgi:branched-chain amino acid transport system permease protein
VEDYYKLLILIPVGVIAGFIIGVGETLFVAYLPDNLVGLRPLFIWIVFFALLIFKPSGLFRPNIK